MNKNSFCVFWDWNGTIVDDAWLFVEILNGFLKENNEPEIDIDYYKNNFCFPVSAFYKDLNLYKSSLFFNALSVLFISQYKKRMFEPVLVPGVFSIIKKLNALGIKQYVVSAQKNSLLKQLVAHYKMNVFFDRVVGVDNSLALGKVRAAKKLSSSLDNNIKRVVVGDTLLDFEVAKKIKGQCLLVDWGHYSFSRLARSGPVVVSSAQALLENLWSPYVD